MTTTALNILVFADSKPGHENQSFGLTQALSRLTKTNVTKTRPVSHIEAIASLCAGKTPRPWKTLEQPDLIIGTGAGTQLSLIAAKKHFNCYTVVLSGPSFPESLFDLCVIPEHDNRAAKKNVVFTLGVLNKVTPSTTSNSSKGLILIGGESKHYRWDSEKVTQQIQAIINQAPDTQWLATNSRRTPADFTNHIKNLSNRIEFLSWESTPSNWLPKEIAKAGQIWVTPDSVSMVYESITSGNPVYLFELKSLNTKVASSIENLRLSQTGQIQSGKIIPARSSTALWEADRIAKIVLDKLN